MLTSFAFKIESQSQQEENSCSIMARSEGILWKKNVNNMKKKQEIHSLFPLLE